MELLNKINGLLKEAEIYRSQRLLREALLKLKETGELIEHSTELDNKEDLLGILAKKTADLETVLEAEEAEGGTAPISSREQQIIKNLFATKTNKGNDTLAAFDGAKTLVKFGQFDQALKEFKVLLSNESFKIRAAKNILMCHRAIAAMHDPVNQLRRWRKNGQFGPEQLEELEAFLEKMTTGSGRKEALGEDASVDIAPQTKAPEAPARQAPQSESAEEQQSASPEESREEESSGADETTAETAPVESLNDVQDTDSVEEPEPVAEFPQASQSPEKDPISADGKMKGEGSSEMGTATETGGNEVEKEIEDASPKEKVESAVADEAPSDSSAEEYTDIFTEDIGTSSKKSASQSDASEKPEEDYIDFIQSVGVEIPNGARQGQKVKFKVLDQHKNVLGVVVPSEYDDLMNQLEPGNRLQKVDFNSLISMFTGSCKIGAVEKLTAGPHQGNFRMEVVIEET